MNKAFEERVGTLENYIMNFGDDVNSILNYYMIFLVETDYIPNKLMESKILGIECKDYSEELAARQYAREQINLLRG